jgi:serine/threonine-protein kinase
VSSTADLLDELRQFHLLDPAQLDELTRRFQDQPAEPRPLARTLVAQGWLTPYQANQLVQGRGRELLLGSYVLLDKLGEGGMGAVFKARNWKLGQVVALKLIRKERVDSADAVPRFQREIRAAAQLEHPHIVRALDADEVGGTLLLVMEYVEGIDLKKLVQQQGPLPVPLACEYVRQAALGLQHAHAKGLVHRDIKPSNLLLQKPAPGQAGAGPVVKILDLGLARLGDGADGDTGTLTETGAVMGTPDYLAPEQARQSHSVDVRADLYSLGCTLYFLLTGQVPFPGGTFGEKIARHLMDEPVPVEQVRPEVPVGIALVVRKLMAKQPEQRYQTPAELAAVLARGGEPAPDSTAPNWSRVTDPDQTVAFTPAGNRARRRGRVWLLAGGGALVGLLLLEWLLAGAFRPRPGKVGVEFRLEANLPWQDTGVDVVEGRAVTLTPEGIWRKGQDACSAKGLGSMRRDRTVWPEAPLLCLLVRVGDEPTPTPVLEPQAFKPRRSGRLFAQANDLDLEGNSGSLQLTIEGGLHTDEAVPPPGPTPVQAADRDLKPLLAHAEAPGAKTEAVCAEVFAYCRKYAGTPHAARAAQLLRQLPPLTNSIGMKMVPVPAGTFLMGSETDVGEGEPATPQHEVTLTRPFYLGVHEVTVGQFRVFTRDADYRTEAENGSGAHRLLLPDKTWKQDAKTNWREPGFDQTDDQPVVCVSWNDAMEFCAWLSKKEGKTYTLPTEAQWEYACRAGSRSQSSFVGEDAELALWGWYGDNSEMRTHPVGQKRTNAWGLYDMHGNAWEWCLDGPRRYDKAPVKDPSPEGHELRVLRGGCWWNGARDCRTAFRLVNKPATCYTTFGFRVLVVPPVGTP